MVWKAKVPKTCAWDGCEREFIPTNSKHKFCPTCAIISKQTYFKRTYIPKPLKTHCKWGHEFTPENTIIRPRVSGRRCRICHSKQAQCRRFGITVETYDLLYTFQRGICAIRNCGRPAIAIDHDHSCCNGRFSCGKCVRGLICLLCNSGLGFFMDDPERLDGAAEYIRRSRENPIDIQIRSEELLPDELASWARNQAAFR